MPFAIYSNPPKPKKAKLKNEINEENDHEENDHEENDHEKNPKVNIKYTKKQGEIAISCEDPLCEDNN